MSTKRLPRFHAKRETSSQLQSQRGMSLLFAMLALIALSFAAAGLVRSASSGALVIGNLGFKADTAAFTDRGAEAAIAWVAGQDDLALENDTPEANATGYYAASYATLDPANQHPTTVNRVLVGWNGDAACGGVAGISGCLTPSTPVTVGDNTYSYVITRMCEGEGPANSLAPPNTCISGLDEVASPDDSKNAIDYQNSGIKLITANPKPSYRIVVRASGGRNAVSYTETIIRK